MCALRQPKLPNEAIPNPRILLTVAAPVPPQEALVCEWRADHAQLGALPDVRDEALQCLMAAAAAAAAMVAAAADKWSACCYMHSSVRSLMSGMMRSST
jgi:hypothetical protein